MGEIALVDSSSPIAQSGLVFENILLDENATCHFALGSAYPTCITGGSTMNDRELTAVGANRSRQHVDFMFGTPHTSIVATCADGKEIPVMEEGRVLL
jgi:aminopeptidase